MLLTATFLFASAGLAVAGASASQEAENQGSIGIRLAEAPVDRADDPRALMYIIDHVAPGAQFDRRIRIVNSTTEDLPVELYAGAARVAGGTFKTLRGRAANELTSWLSITPSQATVDPGGSMEATVEIDVPTDASPGEYYAVVWAEPPAAGSEVRVINRVGIRVYLSVGGGTEPPSDFEIHTLTAGRDQSGRPTVEATLENTGGRALDITGELDLRDGPGGISAGPFGTTALTTVAPGASSPISFQLDPALPAGPWLARIRALSGTLEKAVEATIVFPEAAGELAEPVEATEVPLHQDRGFLLPLALGLLILALFLVFLVWWWRRRRDDEDAEEGERAGEEQATVVAGD